jgi:hypothetical protein
VPGVHQSEKREEEKRERKRRRDMVSVTEC